MLVTEKYKEKGCCELKKTKKIIVLVLAFAMILSLAACSKKPIDYKTFRDIMEDEFDFKVTKMSADKGVDKSYYATDEDYDYTVTYTLFDDEEDAEEQIEDMIDDIEKDIKKDRFDGDFKKSGSGSYKKLVANGEDEDGNDIYIVVIRSKDMIITAMTDSTKKSDIKQIDDIIKKLGY